ncbi:MAG: hypothetical protein H6826_13590 [Planctomycetes bacterium]|nr:hypothetical protein [Planctomycetota bacterium]
MTLKQDMKVYYETFPESLYHCDFCSRAFRTLRGLRNHAVAMHAVEMDAAREAFRIFADAHEADNYIAADVPAQDDPGNA